MNSSKIASELTALIIKSFQYNITEDNLKKLKAQIKKSIKKKKEKQKKKNQKRHRKINKEKRLVNISTLTGVSN